MTGISGDDTRLLVLFGEMRGDLKSLLRSQEELNARLTLSEASTHERINNLSSRVKSLENVKLKVATFATALGAFAALLGSKAGPFITKLASTLGG